MPIFEYVCRECRHRFEAIVTGSQKANCPKCEGRKLEQQVSRFGVGGERERSFTSGSFGRTHTGSPISRATTTGRKNN